MRRNVNREAIKEDVERILTSFATQLERVGSVERVEIRGEEETRDARPEQNAHFRERFFKNAPHDEEGFILTERKTW